MSLNNLMISNIDSQYTPEYIVDVFWDQRIAKVSNITIIPYIDNSVVYNIAYIKIGEWCDNELAYNIINMLKCKNVEVENIEARIRYTDDKWWVIKLNTDYSYNMCIGEYTMEFDSSYFISDDDELESTPGPEEENVIKGLYDEFYSETSVIKHIFELKKYVLVAQDRGDKWLAWDIQREINYLEKELNKHLASKRISKREIDECTEMYD